jgi:hypothetical protein
MELGTCGSVGRVTLHLSPYWEGLYMRRLRTHGASYLLPHTEYAATP